MPAYLELSATTEVEALDALLERLTPERLQGAMKNFGEAAVPLARDAFQHGKDPYGKKWKALQKSTLEAFVGRSRKRRKAYGSKPLLRTSALVNSLNWRLVNDPEGPAVAVGASQGYAKYHQGDPDHPSRNIVPQRAFLPTVSRGLPEAWRDELVDALEAYLAVGGEP